MPSDDGQSAKNEQVFAMLDEIKKQAKEQEQNLKAKNEQVFAMLDEIKKQAKEQEQNLKTENEKLKAEREQAQKREQTLKAEKEQLEAKLCEIKKQADQREKILKEQVDRVLADLEASKTSREQELAAGSTATSSSEAAGRRSMPVAGPFLSSTVALPKDASVFLTGPKAGSDVAEEEFFGSKDYYEGKLCQDERYQPCKETYDRNEEGKYVDPKTGTEYTKEEIDYEKTFTLKAENGIKLWTLAVDVRDNSGCRLRDDDLVLFHYTHKEAFFGITSAKSNEVHASRFMEVSIFGYGVYTTRWAPHTWRSKNEVLLNNYFPAYETWKKKINIEWPEELLKHSQKEPLTAEQAKALLESDFGKELVRGRRARCCDYCIALVCERSRVKDIMRDATSHIWMPNHKDRAPGTNQWGEVQPLWRDVWILELCRKEELGPGYVQFTVEHASQPLDLVVGVLQKRLSQYSRDSTEAKTIATYLEAAEKEMNKGWFGYISSGETSLLDLGLAFKALDKLKEPLRQSLENFEIPNIVVVGSTSAGKSAVLRRFSQLPFFPSAEGMCTRIPIRVEMRKSHAGVAASARMSVHRYDHNAGRYLEEPEPGQSWPIDLEEAIETVNEKMQELLRKTELLEGQHMITKRELRIRVTSENFPILNLVDLPGLVAYSGAQDRRAKDHRDTMDLFKRYISGGHSLCLCIMPATDTPDRWDPVHLIEQEKLQTNSMGIVTKCDLLRTEHHKQDLRKWLTLKARDEKNWVHLQYGFVAVAAGAESEQQKVQDVDQMEQATFQRLRLLPDLPDETCIKSVRKKIAAAYLQQVYESWFPSALKQVLLAWIASAKKLEKAEKDSQDGINEHMQSCDKAFTELEQMYKTFRNLQSDDALTWRDFNFPILPPETCGIMHGIPKGQSGPCNVLISNWWKAGHTLKFCELNDLEDLLRKLDVGDEETQLPTRDIEVARRVNEAFNAFKTVDVVNAPEDAVKKVKALEGVIDDLDGSWNLRKALVEAVQPSRKFLHSYPKILTEWADDATGPGIVQAAIAGDAIAVLGWLRYQPAAVHRTNSTGMTALHWAAASNYVDVAKLLLAANAPLGAQDHSGKTPLDWAQARGDSGMIEILKEAASQN